MKAKISKEVIVTLSMTKNEAIWLASLVENPFKYTELIEESCFRIECLRVLQNAVEVISCLIKKN